MGWWEAVRNCGVDWQASAAWVGALFTGGLLIAAFIAWRTDRAHAKGVREDLVRSVARRVAAWPHRKPTYIQDQQGIGIAQLKVVLFNGSDEPVHDVRVEIGGRGLNVPDLTKRLLPPGPDTRTMRDVEIRTLEAHPPARRNQRPEWQLDAEDFDVRVSFRDGSNRRWIRETDGSLREDSP